MTFCVSGVCGELHGVRGDELAPHRGRANHGLKAVKKILANYNNGLASTGPAFGRGNCFYDGGHSTRVNAWKIKIKTVTVTWMKNCNLLTDKKKCYNLLKISFKTHHST